MFWAIWSVSEVLFWAIWSASEVLFWAIWSVSEVLFWATWSVSEVLFWAIWSASEVLFPLRHSRELFQLLMNVTALHTVRMARIDVVFDCFGIRGSSVGTVPSVRAGRLRNRSSLPISRINIRLTSSKLADGCGTTVRERKVNHRHTAGRLLDHVTCSHPTTVQKSFEGSSLASFRTRLIFHNEV